MKNTANHRSVIVAAIFATVVMFALGVGYRAAAAWLVAPVLAEPISQERLEQLPMQIGDWAGQEISMDPNVIDATDTDACLSRHYARHGGLEGVSLWIASGVQTRDLMPHRPEVCYVGNGYTLTSQRSAELSIDAHTVLPCNIMQFAKGDLRGGRVMVLYYYLVDGIYCQDVGQWRYRVFDRIGYVTQVQIVAPLTSPPGADAVDQRVREFACEFAVPIAQLFEGLGQDPNEQ